MSRELKLCYFFLLFNILLSCKTTQVNNPSGPAAGMFKVSIFYPNGEDKTFNMDYYEKNHMPMVAGFLGNILKFYEIDKGVSGRSPNDKPIYLAVGHFYVTDINEYSKAIAEHREAVVADFANYTNTQPVVLISEVNQVKFNSIK